MKLLIMAVLMLIANSQCYPTDGVFETVKDTTSAIKNGIGGMLSRGRSLVFGENHEEESAKAGKRAAPSVGIIDKISLKIHDVSDGVRQTVRNVLQMTDKDTNGNGKGIIKHVYSDVTNKFDRVKGLLFGTTTQKSIENTDSDDEKKLKELVDNILAKNNSSQEGVKQTYDMLNNILNNTQKNKTEVKIPTYPTHDGAGLIDIRALELEDESNLKAYADNSINGINTAYDKVEDSVSDTVNRGKESFNSFRQNVADNFNNGKNYFKDNVDRFASDARNNFERYTN